MDRQTEGLTDRHSFLKRCVDASKNAKERQKHCIVETERWTYRQTDRQADRQTNIQTERQTQTVRQTVRQTDRETDCKIDKVNCY